MTGLLEMPSDQLVQEGGREPRQTITVAKQLAVLAKKNAVLRGQKLKVYIKPVLDECIAAIEDEVRSVGSIGVRDRAEQHTSAVSEIGTLNTSPDIAVRLTSLAGQCLTSVAKLTFPHLKRILEDHFGRPDWKAKEGLFGFRYMISECGDEHFDVEDDSLAAYDLTPGDILGISRSGEIEPGDRILVIEDGIPTLRTVVDKPVRLPKKIAPAIQIDTARQVMFGKVTVEIRFPRKLDL